MLDEKDEKQNKNGFLKSLGSLFSGYRESETPENSTVFEDAPISSASTGGFIGGDNLTEDSGEADVIVKRKLPPERALRYAEFDDIRRSGVGREGVNIHVTHALAPDSKTKQSCYLRPKKPEFQKLADELNKELIPKINDGILNWARVSCDYGVSYVQPVGEEGKGIVAFDFNYWTLPHFVREYNRGGSLAGFTNQHMRTDENQAVNLIPPWELIAFKMPMATPDIDIVPDPKVTALFNLKSKQHREIPVETQDYGESFYEAAFDAYNDFMDAIESLNASRLNASKRERLTIVDVGQLSPRAAAQYLDEILQSLKSEEDHKAKVMKAKGLRSTVEEKVIPARQGSSIDTNLNEITPNIQHIEDILFHLKRFCSAMGLDYTMMGWADMMSGGLGEGGFLQTSIQAERRASQIRTASDKFIQKASLLHLYYKHKKTFPFGEAFPFEIVYNSMTATLRRVEEDEAEKRANRAAIQVATVDQIVQGSTKQSPTLTKKILGETLDVSEEELDTIVKELYAGQEPDDGDSQDALMAALERTPEAMQLVLAKLMSEDVYA